MTKVEGWPPSKGGYCEREGANCVHLSPKDYETARRAIAFTQEVANRKSPSIIRAYARHALGMKVNRWGR